MIGRLFLAFALLAGGAIAQTRPAAPASAYRSPYEVKFSVSEAELVGDLLHGTRANWKDYAEAPYAEWYDRANLRRWGHWGPGMKQLSPPASASGKNARWLRERVIATGLRYVGYGYEHHHVPDWQPPEDWPRSQDQTTPSGKGVDCSNFTGFVYDLALGLLPFTDVHLQADMTEVKGPGPGRTTKVQRIELPKNYADFERTLRTADLLFIKNNRGVVSHVVLWVGSPGRSPKGHPLVLDSTGTSHRDYNGETIPEGVQLRPCTERSWYFASASHAIRIIPD